MTTKKNKQACFEETAMIGRKRTGKYPDPHLIARNFAKEIADLI